MKIRNLLILGLVLVGFTYCSSDDVLDGPATGNGTEVATGDVKIQLTVKMPTGTTTRSTTDTNTGVEAGVEDDNVNENKVNKVLVAIINSDGATVKQQYTSLLTNTAGTGSTFYTTEEFNVTGLGVDQQYYVYAFVNPYKDAITELNDVFAAKGTLKATIDAITRVGGTEGAEQTNFFMSNAEEAQVIKVEKTHIQGAPLKVGVSVQRAVARMDYVYKKEAETNILTYSIGSSDVKVTFKGYKLINTSKSFYDLKRVSSIGEVAATGTIGAAESIDNYVVDTDWTTKSTTLDGTGFFNYMGKASTVTVSAYNSFDVRSYVTENTMPAEVAKKGMATAVVFKGHLNFTDEVKTKYGITVDTENVYVWNNQFYGGFDKLPAAIKAIGANNKTALAAAGVTAYSKDTDDTFPIYYVYYNRHNDNGDPAVTGAMEFAVVRNNVYKLTINSLSKFGHPNDPELEPTNNPNPDPTPEKPGDSIESADLYMQVTATVLDWTVRTNNIEF